jgi:hypothetical protein
MEYKSGEWKEGAASTVLQRGVKTVEPSTPRVRTVNTRKKEKTIDAEVEALKRAVIKDGVNKLFSLSW